MDVAQNSTQTLKYLASIHYATELEDVGQLCRTLKTHCGLSGLMIQKVEFDGDKVLNSSCRCFGGYMRFHSQYIEDEVFIDDPLLLVGSSLQFELNWDRRDLFGRHLHSFDRMRKLMGRHDMNSGLSYVKESMHEENTLHAVHIATSDTRLDSAQEEVFERILPYLIRLSERDWITESPRLSQRQLTIATYLKDGYSARQTANKLKLSHRAVKFHINRLTETLNASNLEEALSILESHCLF